MFVCVQESGLCVCGLCVVIVFAALFERLICSFPTPLRFLRPSSLPLCVLAIVEGPFQGHPANTFAVLLATLVVDKQCLVAGARRRGAERSKRIVADKRRGRDAHRNSASKNTRGATKGTFQKQREKRNETEGRTGRRTDGQRNSQKTTINDNSRTNTRDITFHSPQRSHQHRSQQWLLSPLWSFQKSNSGMYELQTSVLGCVMVCVWMEWLSDGVAAQSVAKIDRQCGLRCRRCCFVRCVCVSVKPTFHSLTSRNDHLLA